MLTRLILGCTTKLGKNRGGEEWHIPWSIGTVAEERWLFPNDKKIE